MEDQKSRIRPCRRSAKRQWNLPELERRPLGIRSVQVICQSDSRGIAAVRAFSAAAAELEPLMDMFATVVYSYNYSSYAVWVWGSIGAAFMLSRAYPRIPKSLASLLGFSAALVTAYGIGQLRIDLFVAHQLEFYFYFFDGIFESWDYFYTVPKTVLFDLLPFYYAYRFLSMSGRDSVLFAIVPAVVAAFLVFQGLCTEFIRLAYPESIFALPFVHVIVAGLFILCSRKTEPSSSASVSETR